MKCPKCETKNEEGAKFCKICGTELKDKKTINKKILIIGGIIGLVIAIAIASLFIFSGSSAKEYTDKLETAQKYVEDKDYEKAETAYLEAIDIDPKKADAYVELADVYVEQERYDDAEEIIEQALENVSEDEKPKVEEKEETVSRITGSFSSYAEIFMEYYEKYGNVYESLDQYGIRLFQGLCYSLLLDFNNDGIEELLLVYCENDEYFYDLYSYEDELVLVNSSKEWYDEDGTLPLYIYDGIYESLIICSYDGCYYILAGYNVHYYAYETYLGFDEDNQFAIIDEVEYDSESEETRINGKVSSDEEVEEVANKYEFEMKIQFTSYSDLDRETVLEALNDTAKKLGLDMEIVMAAPLYDVTGTWCDQTKPGPGEDDTEYTWWWNRKTDFTADGRIEVTKYRITDSGTYTISSDNTTIVATMTHRHAYFAPVDDSGDNILDVAVNYTVTYKIIDEERIQIVSIEGDTGEADVSDPVPEQNQYIYPYQP